MKYLFVFYLFLITFYPIYAVPAKKNLNRTHLQSNGNFLNIYLTGDEFFKLRKTSDEVILVKNSDGDYYYAESDFENNSFIKGKYIANNPENRTLTEIAYIDSLRDINQKLVSQIYSSSRQKSKTAIKPYSALKTKASKNFGLKTNIPIMSKSVVILVEFSDKSFNSKHTNELFNDMMNKEGYSYDDATGSVSDYFKDQSSGNFILNYDVIGPVKLPNKRKYYGGNDRYENDLRPQEMIFEACKAIDHLIDFSKYDYHIESEYDQETKKYNDIKVLDFVYVIYAGYGEAQSGAEDDIWPHKWDISDMNLILDGIKISEYACSSELSGGSGTYLDGIGTCCHESSHILGLPDLYDTTYGGNFGMSDWDIMDSGSYLNYSRTPCSFSAYERMYLGWLTPKELNNPELITLNPLNTSNEGCILYNENSRNEFFIFENRQLNGWDSYLPASGMLITKVKYNQYDWDNNIVNDHFGKQRVTIIPADNELLTYNYDGWENNYEEYYLNMEYDTYPGKSNNRSFTSTSSPKSIFSDGSIIDKPITEINENNGIINFNFNNYNPNSICKTLSNDDIIIFTQKGKILISNCNNKNINIYNASGVLINSINTTEDKYSIDVPQGIYFVKSTNTYKVVVEP